MSEKSRTILICASLILVIIGVYWWGISNSPPPSDNEILSRLKKIESQLDSIEKKKDSVKTVIITVDKEIIKNEKHYEKVVNDIIHQPDSVNRIFTNDYIKRYIDKIRRN